MSNIKFKSSLISLDENHTLFKKSHNCVKSTSLFCCDDYKVFNDYICKSKNGSGKICFNSPTLFNKLTSNCYFKYFNEECISCSRNDGCHGNVCGKCKQCLIEIHFPNVNNNNKTVYDCERMLDFYVCAYSAKYASEILYIMKPSDALKQINESHVVSIGCGPCPDLMAFE